MSIWIRVILWAGLLAAVVLWRFGDPAGSETAGSTPETHPESAKVIERRIGDTLPPRRQASREEWGQSITELGVQKRGKLLITQSLTAGVRQQAGGLLVWFDDGAGERLAYLPGFDDADPIRAAMVLRASLEDQTTQLLNMHGDPGLLDRMPSLNHVVGLPQGWEVLTPPRAVKAVP